MRENRNNLSSNIRFVFTVRINVAPLSRAFVIADSVTTATIFTHHAILLSYVRVYALLQLSE